MNFWVLEERANHRILRNELKISGVDFHGVQRFHLGMVCQDLRPRPGGQANDKNSFRGRAEGAEGVRASYEIGVMYWIDIELAVVNAATEDGSVLRYADNAVPILQHMGEWDSGL